jgi:hypothetical protein
MGRKTHQAGSVQGEKLAVKTHLYGPKPTKLVAYKGNPAKLVDSLVAETRQAGGLQGEITSR